MKKALTIYRKLIAAGHGVSLNGKQITVTLCKPMADSTKRSLSTHAAELVELLTIQPGRWHGEDSSHKLFTRAAKVPRP